MARPEGQPGGRRVASMKLDRTTILLAAGALLVSAIVAFTVIRLAVGPRSTQTGIRVFPSQGSTQTTASSTPTETTGPGYTIESTLPPGMTSADVSAALASGGTGPIARVAFILGDKLTVAHESGKDHFQVARWTEGGAYALSPDRRRIAFTVPDVGGMAHLYVTLVGGERLDVGVVVKESGFGWMPDSRRLVAAPQGGVGAKPLGVISTAGGPVMRLGVDGRHPVASPDGKWIAFLKSAPGPRGSTISELWRVGSGGKGALLLAKGKDVSDMAWLASDELVVVEKGAGAAQDRLVRLDLLGGELVTLASGAPGGMGSLHRVLTGSESGLVAYDVVGDDGYSRIYTVDPEGRSRRQLPGDRDVYPLAWSIDGDRLFFIEGNTYQGEGKLGLRALVSSTPLGTGKQFVVSGARL